MLCYIHALPGNCSVDEKNINLQGYGNMPPYCKALPVKVLKNSDDVELNHSD
jgi:hypothetical protein